MEPTSSVFSDSLKAIDFKHSYERRKNDHDYRAPFKYHIILKKNKEFREFGKIIGDASIAPGHRGCAEIDYTPIGQVIKKELFDFNQNFPGIQNLQFQVMPDHVHVLLWVKERLPKHLGNYIGDFKRRVAERYSRRVRKEYSANDIFNPNYTDRIIWSFIKIETIVRYISENPHRLAMRQQYPQFFKRIRNLRIGNDEVEAYGNLFLLRNPDKMSLIIHRVYNNEKRISVAEDCLCHCLEGGIIVSAAIHEDEKLIWNFCEKAGGKFILIQAEEFGQVYKPSEKLFRLCEKGRLLIISIKQPAKTSLSRQLCLRMNKLAETICEDGRAGLQAPEG